MRLLLAVAAAVAAAAPASARPPAAGAMTMTDITADGATDSENGTAANLTGHVLPGNAVCMNGCPAEVMVTPVRDPSLWVITLGGLSPPGGTGWCLSGEACAWEANMPW
eukprot:SAG22_NODE_3933_length_1463_cov_1.607771_1_plen_109_part_00